MKKYLKILSLALLVTSLTSLVSCGEKKKKDENEIYVCVYDGGYGTKWIEELAKQYEEDTGIKVNWQADDSILDRVEDQLKNGSDYDIIMSHDINWQNYAAQGLLANLDDLYETNVYNSETKFKDKLVDGALDLSKSEGQDGNEHYYKVCYTQGAGGLIYNIDMFNKNGWKVPTTYDELKTLCQTIVDAKIDTGSGKRGDYVKPFAWSGNDRQYYWDYLVFEWWAELAGLEKINTIKEYKGPDGKYSTGYEMYNPDTYYKEFMQAYEMWYDLIALNSSYSLDNAYAENLAKAKSAFVNGQAAMIPYAQWAKYELEQVTDSKKLDFNIAMMKTPKVSIDSLEVNYMVGFGDSMIIPENAISKDLAKGFLTYLASDKALKTFVKESQGAFLAFNYDNVDLEELKKDTYTNSVLKKLTESTKFTLASKSPLTTWTTNSVMPWINNEYYYSKACKTPSENTKEIIGQTMYTVAKQNWPIWCRSANVSNK